MLRTDKLGVVARTRAKDQSSTHALVQLLYSDSVATPDKERPPELSSVINRDTYVVFPLHSKEAYNPLSDHIGPSPTLTLL